MNVLWPVFHDPSYRPALAERLTLHWKANLRHAAGAHVRPMTGLGIVRTCG